jgi:hypothetical protein
MSHPSYSSLQLLDYSSSLCTVPNTTDTMHKHHYAQASEHDTASAATAQRTLAWLSPPRWCPVQQAQQAQLHISDCNSDSPSQGDAPPEPILPILHSPSLCDASPQTSRRPRILIADSNTMCQQLLSRVLQAADCECLVVGTGAAVVDLLLV